MYRRLGHTTYILNAAIYNPNVIIVTANYIDKKRLHFKYYQLLSNKNIIIKTLIFLRNRIFKLFNKNYMTEPKFIAYSEIYKHIKGRALNDKDFTPFVFDNNIIGIYK